MRMNPQSLLLLAILTLAGCGAASAPTTSFNSEFGVSIPDSWQMASTTLTPNLSDPKEVLSVGTFSLRPGGPQCAQVPVNALHDLGPRDVFVTLHERLQLIEADTRAFPDPPSSFRSELRGVDDGVDAIECMDPIERDDLGALRWLRFQESGRFFYLLVAIGRDTPPDRFEETVGILDTMVINPQS